MSETRRVQRVSNRLFMDSNLSHPEPSQSMTYTSLDAASLRDVIQDSKPLVEREKGGRGTFVRWRSKVGTSPIGRWLSTSSPGVWEVRYSPSCDAVTRHSVKTSDNTAYRAWKIDVGGCAGIVVGYPLDTVKVHMQTQDYRNPRYRGTWHCLRTLLAKESVTGLYRGISSPTAGVAVVNAIIFGAYGQARKHLSDSDRLSAHFLAGAAAGIAQAPINSPIELAKTRLQLQSGNEVKFSGPMQCLKHVYKIKGLRGVFKGLSITCVREAPSFGAYFATYEALTRTSGKEQISTPRMLLAGGLAGSASWAIAYPADVVKSRIQAECGNRYSSSWDCLKQSVKAEGVSCLYRGLTSAILRAFPTNAATFAVVTWTFRLLGQESGVSQASGSTSNTTINGISDDYEPMFNKWNVLLQRVSDDRTLQRSYYSTLPSSMTLTLVSTISARGHTSVNRTSSAIVEAEYRKCEEEDSCTVEYAELPENLDEIDLAVLTQTIVECNRSSTTSGTSPMRMTSL